MFVLAFVEKQCSLSFRTPDIVSAQQNIETERESDEEVYKIYH